MPKNNYGYNILCEKISLQLLEDVTRLHTYATSLFVHVYALHMY